MIKIDKQEKFWKEEFGDDYIQRNNHGLYKSSQLAFFSRIFRNKMNISSVLEFGANIGVNLKAISTIRPYIKTFGVEINSKACEILKSNCDLCYNESINDFNTFRKFDMTLTHGLLIHINPKALKKAYTRLYSYSNRYILMCEYFSKQPVTVKYRKHEEMLFKRDFAEDFMKSFKVNLIDYGFTYHNDNMFDFDDINWWLFEKR